MKREIKRAGTREVANPLSAMLKKTDPVDWKTYLASFIIKASRLHLQTLPDPDELKLIVDSLYNLLVKTWPGATLEQVWRTIEYGLGKQGGGYLKINYSTLANWLTYHRQLSPGSQREEEIRELAPIKEQADLFLSGLAEYRKRVEAGEYTPRGKEGRK